MMVYPVSVAKTVAKGLDEAMSGQRLVPLAVMAFMVGLATASAQHAPGGGTPRRAPAPDAQSDVGGARPQDAAALPVPSDAEPLRSEERRVGKECRARWGWYH